MIGKLREPRKRSSRLRIDKPGAIPYRFLHYRYLSGRNSAVECQLPKLDVAGSIPVARSKFLLKNQVPFFGFLAEKAKSSQNVPTLKVDNRPFYLSIA